MKKSSKVLALLLAVLTLLSCVSIAADPTPSPEYDDGGKFTYVAFGDSYTRGMGCSDTWEEDTELDYGWYDHQSRNVPGSYSYIVAQALGCDTETENGWLDESDATYWPLIQNGQRIAGIMDFFGLEDGYWDDYFYHDLDRGHARRYEKMVKYFGNPASKWRGEDDLYGDYGTVYDARELVKEADLITLQLGMAEVLNRPIYAACQEFLGGDLNFDGADTETIVKFAARVVENMMEGYQYFVEYYPVLLKYISELNENGEVMVLNAVNPAYGINISNDLLIPIGNAFSVITAQMNLRIKQWAEEYDLTLIDISNVDTGAIVNDWTLIDDIINGDKDEVATHPSPEGHAQIARQIISAYKNSDSANSHQIRLDIGRFETVTSVMIDGKSTNHFTLEDKVLTVECYDTSAKLLTISYTNSEGKIVSSTYQLTWDASDGYSTYRIYTTNDMTAIVTGLLDKIENLVASIIDKLFK